MGYRNPGEHSHPAAHRHRAGDFLFCSGTAHFPLRWRGHARHPGHRAGAGAAGFPDDDRAAQGRGASGGFSGHGKRPAVRGHQRHAGHAHGGGTGHRPGRAGRRVHPGNFLFPDSGTVRQPGSAKHGITQRGLNGTAHRPRDPPARRCGAGSRRPARLRALGQSGLQRRHLHRRLRVDGAGHFSGADAGVCRAVFHRSVQCVSGDAHRLCRHDHGGVFPALYAHRARPRAADRGASEALSQYVPGLHVHHAAGADHQQSRPALGGDGSGHADHRAAGFALPHQGQPGGGLEILHPVWRGYRAGAVRHRAAVFRGGAGAGPRGHERVAVDAARCGQRPAGARHHRHRLRLFAGGLRHQGRPGSLA